MEIIRQYKLMNGGFRKKIKIQLSRPDIISHHLNSNWLTYYVFIN